MTTIIIALTVSCFGLIGISAYTIYTDYRRQEFLLEVLERMADLEQIAHSMMEEIK